MHSRSTRIPASVTNLSSICSYLSRAISLCFSLSLSLFLFLSLRFGVFLLERASSSSLSFFSPLRSLAVTSDRFHALAAFLAFLPRDARARTYDGTGASLADDKNRIGERASFCRASGRCLVAATGAPSAPLQKRRASLPVFAPDSSRDPLRPRSPI